MAVRKVDTSLHQTDVRSQSNELEFVIYQDSARQLLGSEPSIQVALQEDESIFHEAGAYFSGSDRDSVFVTSNILKRNGKPEILVHRLSRSKASPNAWQKELVPSGDAVMANGGVPTPAKDAILFCAQGSRTDAGGLVLMSKDAPFKTKLILRSYHGRWFNSLNDVVYASDGSIWFTDPIYGFEQQFRSKPQLPCQLYRFDPVSNDVRVVADGFSRPNGLCFSPDGSTLYVTDTDWIHGDGTIDEQRVSHIYAFTVKEFHGAAFLTEKRLFAMADCGVPDGIKTDTKGNVYSGCGDGVNVWDPAGRLILKIMVPGGVANFCFGAPGEVLMLNETRFVVAHIAKDVVSPY